jgi:hypothetical protein
MSNAPLAVMVAALAAAMIPMQTLGACVAGSPHSYDDIRYVYVRQYSLTGILWPSYEYEAAYFPARDTHTARASVSLSARRAVPFRGNLVAVDPLGNFARVVQVLRSASFFDMRLTPATHLYIDGPEDAITVVACGITWTLGLAGEGGEVNLDDSLGHRYFKLLEDLRATIFSAKWMEPTPPP